MTTIDPEDLYREVFTKAVRSFWSTRALQAQKQVDAGKTDAGTRGEVTGGAHLHAMAELVETIFVDAGIPKHQVRRSGRLNLPGYYRATKNWDLLVIDGDRLVAAIEFKSQVGSFGNNFNNRTEEAIGNATDLWRAYRAGLLGSIKPWVGFMMFLEEAPGSTKPVQIPAMTFPHDPAFGDAPSYKKRYELLLDRLYRDDLYNAGCLFTSSADPEAPIHEPVAELSFQNFAAAIKGRATQVLNMDPSSAPGDQLF